MSVYWLKRVAWVLCVCAALATVSATTVRAQTAGDPPPRDPEAEDTILQRLAEVSAEASLEFAKATQSFDTGNLQTAKAGFERVLEMVPRSPDAVRRLSQVELALGDVFAARSHAYRAYGYDPSPLNLAAVAEARMAFEDEASIIEALTLARAAALLLPEDESLQLTHVAAAIGARDMDAVGTACGPLVRMTLGADGYGEFCEAIALAEVGGWSEAEGHLLRAAELGVPAEAVEWALSSDIRRRAWLERRLYRVGWVMLGYSAAPLVFLGAGVGLGRMTVAVARHSARRGELRVSMPERFMHGAYRIVIVLTSVYYYASIPLLWLALVAAWIGAILQAYAGHPLWLRFGVILSLVVVQYVLAVVYVGLSARMKHPEPGRSLKREEAPGLWTIVEDLGAQMDTRPIDAVYAIPDARISVQEEGRARDLLRGRGRRCLVLGLGLVPGMSERQLRAVLAHEYAHFTNRDTAGGQIARQVHASMQRIAVQLTMVGQNKWYSPGWWYVSVFSRIFLLVTMGASRLHEILADRTAARVCGVRDFTIALLHITRQDHTFSAQVRAEMRLAKEEDRPVGNLYTLPPVQKAEVEELEGRIATAMRRPTSRFDTHVSTRERIELLAEYETPDEGSDTSGAVWQLFEDPVGLQGEMTDVIRATVRRREDRLLRAVAEAHDEDGGRLHSLWRRATWFWRADRATRERDS